MEVDDEWEHFLMNSNLDNTQNKITEEINETNNETNNDTNLLNNINIPEPSELYISTKQKLFI